MVLQKKRVAALLAIVLSLMAQRAHADNPPGPAAAPDERASGLRFTVLLGFGVPQPFAVEVLAKIGDGFGLGIEYASLPQSLGDAILSLGGVSNAHLSSDAFALDLRWFPFHGSFFLGGSAGRQSLTASATQSGQTASVDVTTYFVTPRLGWLFVFGNGIALGLDGGAQLPVSSRGVATPPSGGGSSAARAAADLIGSTPFPSVHLRFGYQF